MWQAAQGMMSPTMLPTPSLASEVVWCIVSPLEHLTGLLSPLAGMQRRQPHGLSTCQHGLQLTLLGTFSEASENNSNRERDCSYRDKGQVRRPVVSNRGPQGLITSERVPLKLLAYLKNATNVTFTAIFPLCLLSHWKAFPLDKHG